MKCDNQNKSNVLIRRARPYEIREIMELSSKIPQLLISDSFISIDDMQFCIFNPKGIFLVAIEKEKIVGFLYGNLEFPTTVCLTYVGVHPNYRHHGLGNQMYQIFENESIKLGADTVYVLTTQNAVKSFFTNNGFKNPENLTYMQKRIRLAA